MMKAIRSILDYDWRRLPLGWVRKTCAAVITVTIASAAVPAAAQSTGMLTLTDINQAIVPTSTNTGDRDFNGTPVVVLGVQLRVGRQGRAVFADVLMSARRGGLRTSARQTFLVWRWQPSDGARFVSRIINPTVTMRFDNLPGTCGFGCARVIPGGSTSRSEDGGLIVDRDIRGNGMVRQVRLLGDTMGDDISDDANPHGDTSIRAIRFRPIRVEFSNRLVRR